jgi:hypothetical protein
MAPCPTASDKPQLTGFIKLLFQSFRKIPEKKNKLTYLLILDSFKRNGILNKYLNDILHPEFLN